MADNALKAIDYSEEIALIRGEWNRQHPGTVETPADVADSGWVTSVSSDHVILELDNKLYRVTYTKNEDDVVVFASWAEWTEVVQEFVPAKNNALKTIGRTDNAITTGNYIVLFGGRDLEGIGSPNVNADGSKGEFFTADTDLSSRYTKAGMLYVDWEHTQGEAGDDILGIVDWKTARIDDKGVFVQRVLNRRNQYVRWIDELGWFDDGTLGTSSHAEPEQVTKAANGEILRWPLWRDTLTVSPMEPRNLTDNQLTALKALGIPVPQDTPQPEATPEAVHHDWCVQTAAVAVKANVELFLINALLED